MFVGFFYCCTVHISDPSNFSKEFSTGFLIGEVLHKYELQDDFDQFSQNKYVVEFFCDITIILRYFNIPLTL